MVSTSFWPLNRFNVDLTSLKSGLPGQLWMSFYGDLIAILMQRKQSERGVDKESCRIIAVKIAGSLHS